MSTNTSRTSRLALVTVVATLFAVPVACAQSNGSSPTETYVSPTQTADPTQPSLTPPPADTGQPTGDPGDALPPDVSSVAPNTATVGSIGPSIIVSGNNFVERSIVQLDGAPLATAYVSGTELRATIPTAKLAAVGSLRISVGTSPPGGGASKEVTFDVVNPVATLTSLAPLSVTSGAGNTSLHVVGTGFVDGSKVVFGTTDLATTFTSGTALDAMIPAALLTTSGSTPVKVVNPAPGGGDSTTIAFTVANPNASIQNVSPGTSNVSGPALSLVVTGAGYVTASTVLFNGSPLSTTYVSGGEVHATLPATSLVTAGDFPVVVSNPPPGGGLTAPFTFHVVYPSPAASSLAPSSASAGAPPTEVTVTGIGFFPVSQVTFDGAAAATTYVDASHVKATLTAAQLATGGTIAVRVMNPTPGGGTSSAVSFTVNNPAPSIGTLSPSSVTAGSPDKTITLGGTGFLATSTVKSNGVNVMTTYVNATTLTAVVPSSQLLNPGSVSLTVTNPAPGGGTSAPKLLTVGCDTGGVDVALATVGAVTTLSTSFGTAPAMSVFANPSSCTQTSLDTSQTQPARYWVVQNTTGAPATLAAWAVCTSDANHEDDAFLAIYRRPTPPANDTERLACETVVSEGNGSSGPSYLSPDSGGSIYCPGLTKANGGGITLGVCEKAVVHIQPWSYTSLTYTPPPTIRISAQ